MATYTISIATPNENLATNWRIYTLPQAQLTLPAAAAFPVVRVAAATASSPMSVAADMVRLDVEEDLQFLVTAESASFTPPEVGAATWTAGSVGWSSGTWTNGSQQAGTLSSGSYSLVARCDIYTCLDCPDNESCATTNLVFTLAANAAVKRAGPHTLMLRWRVQGAL